MNKRTIATLALMASGWLPGIERPAAQVAPGGKPPGPEVTGAVSGEIMSGGERLAFANVAVVGTRLGTRTDNAGRLFLAGVPAGPRRILFHALGYRKLDTLLNIRPGENPPVHVELADLHPPPACQPCFWVSPFQGARAIPRGAMVLDFVGERWYARMAGRGAELAISSDPNPCELRIDYYLKHLLLPVSLSVLDSAGRAVHVFDAARSSGGNQIVWDGFDHGTRRTPYGSYRVCLETPGDTLELEFARTRRLPFR